MKEGHIKSNGNPLATTCSILKENKYLQKCQIFCDHNENKHVNFSCTLNANCYGNIVGLFSDVPVVCACVSHSPSACYQSGQIL